MLKRFVVPVAALVASALIGGLAAVGIWEAALDEDGAVATVERAGGATPVVDAADNRIGAIYERTIPGVVEIRAGEGRSPGPFGPGGRSTGSGFVVDEQGRIVTNQHVVGDAERVTVRFHDGDEVEARVLGTDPSTDVALLEVDEVPDDLTVLPLGSSDALAIGDPVVAIGSPFGLQGTVTSGIVSALDRQLQAPDGFTIDGAIQTDAALNPGNSGGPLLDMAGRVVGVNSQIASRTGGNDGVGYAVPIDTVEEIVAQLEESGEVAHPYLGVRIGDAEGGGAQIADVTSGSPAAEAGLEAGDVVLEAGGEEVADGDALRRAVTERRPGDELELRVRRDGGERTLTVELGTRPTS